MDECKQLDSIVTSVIDKIRTRSHVGFDKYGTNMDRSDVSFEQWIVHCQEELMDAMIYLEKIKSMLKNKDNMIE